MTKKNPLQVPVAKGDADYCKQCNAHTVYGGSCVLCSIPTTEAQEKYSGRYWMKT
jgi:hypothetical protein